MTIVLNQSEVERAILDAIERKLAVQERPKINPKVRFVSNYGEGDREMDINVVYGNISVVIEVAS